MNDGNTVVTLYEEVLVALPNIWSRVFGILNTGSLLLWPVLWICIGFNADPDPGSQTNADPTLDPGHTFKYRVTKSWFFTWKINFPEEPGNRSKIICTKIQKPSWKARNQIYLLIFVNFHTPGSGSRKSKWMQIHADPDPRPYPDLQHWLWLGCGPSVKGVQPAPLLLPALLPRQSRLVPRGQGTVPTSSLSSFCNTVFVSAVPVSI